MANIDIYTDEFWAASDKEREELLKSYRSLLHNFGAEVLSLSPGIVIDLDITIGENNRTERSISIPLSTVGWNWIRPLLEELVELREKQL